MATVTILNLPATNTVDATTVAPVVYSGTTYKATLTTLGAFINTNAVAVTASGNIAGGNILTNGLISASGNITAGNFFIGNGSQLTGVVATGIGTLASLSVTGNVTAGNVNVTGLSLSGNVVSALVSAANITTTANVSGSYFLGNGSQLTGIDATSIQNGTSNVRVLSSGGNVSVGIGGTSNVAVFATTGAYVTGDISASGNVTGGNLITAAAVSAASVSASGNVTGGNLITGAAVSATSVSASGNITGGNILGGANVNATTHTGTTASLSGNITGGNILTGGLISATANVNGGNLISAALVQGVTVSASGNVIGGNVNTNTLTGTGVTIGSSGNINLSTTGNIVLSTQTYINNLSTPFQPTDAATKQYVDDVAQGLHTHDSCNAATTTTLATISGGTVTYNNGTSGVGATLTTTGTYTTIDGVTLSNGMRILVKNEVDPSRNGIYDRTSTTVLTRSTDFDTPTEMAGGDFTFVTAGTLYDNTGWVMTDVVTTVGTSPVNWVQFSGAGTYTAGTGLTLTGTVFSVNASQTQVTTVGTLGSLAVTANITGGNILTGGIISSTGNITSGNILTAGLISSTGNITGGNILGGANVNATTHTGSTVSVTGAITGASLTVSTGNITGGNIVNANGNGVGNIGSSSVYFNTVFAKATSAQYADLAEKYTADAQYASGTVLSFGGAQEVTITLTDADHRVAGVVSTNPATIMNAGLVSEHVATVALTGRVPCSVTGTVRKGDSMVSAGNGVARAEANPAISTVIGKSLEDFDGESGMIEIVVGRV
jgi:hypothetical protein